jgi:hypothetical protein
MPLPACDSSTHFAGDVWPGDPGERRTPITDGWELRGRAVDRDRLTDTRPRPRIRRGDLAPGRARSSGPSPLASAGPDGRAARRIWWLIELIASSSFLGTVARWWCGARARCRLGALVVLVSVQHMGSAGQDDVVQVGDTGSGASQCAGMSTTSAPLFDGMGPWQRTGVALCHRSWSWYPHFPR